MNTDTVAEKLISCLRETMHSIGEGTAIAFSGGIDSTVLIHLSGYRLHPYTVGLPGSRDMENALNISRLLGFKIQKVEIGRHDVIDALRFLKYADPSLREVEAGYESVLYLVLKAVRESYIVTGQGSDELFFGYRKYIDGEKSNAADLRKLYNITLPREKEVASLLGKKLITPFLSPCVTGISGMLTWSDCIVNGINKVIVRRAAELAGLPDAVFSMPKKAAQYGSGIQKIIRSINFSYL